MGVEREGESPRWRRVRVGPPESKHYVVAKEIDPRIQAQMPIASETFISMNLIDFAVWRFKKLLHPDREIPF